MEPIILPSAPHHAPNDVSHSPNKSNGSTKPRLASFSTSRDASINWGRHVQGSWMHALGCFSIMLFCPLLVIFFWITIRFYHGSLMDTLDGVREFGIVDFYQYFTPIANLQVSMYYGGWLIFQAALYKFLPSEISTGQLTPAGHLLYYRTNGLFAWIATHLLFLAWSGYGYVDPAIIAKNWEALLVAANVFGFLIPAFAYVKAHIVPSHEGDRKFSGTTYQSIEKDLKLTRDQDLCFMTCTWVSSSIRDLEDTLTSSSSLMGGLG
jgi:hypothetical protein